MTVRDGDEHEYLGMVFKFSHLGHVNISMSKYLQDDVNEHEITAISETPASENLFVISDNSPLLSEDLREDFHRLRVIGLLQV